MSRVPFLRRTVDLVVMDWPHVIPKRMFGEDAWFAQGNIFAFLDSSHERVAVRLTAREEYAAAMALEGSTEFAPGGDGVKNWVVLPAPVCATEEGLEPFLRRAYEDAMGRKPKVLKNRGRAWLE